MDDEKRKKIGKRIVRGLVHGARGAKMAGELMRDGAALALEGLQELSDAVVGEIFIIRPTQRRYDDDK